MGDEFISEDDTASFEGFLRYQGLNIATLNPNELKEWCAIFNDAQELRLGGPKVGRMKLKRGHGEFLYAVAVREGSDLWLVLWVKRSRKGEIFVMIPRSDRDWDPHASYHVDGTFHSKSFGKAHNRQKRQPLTGSFRGTEHLGGYMGFGPKGVGAICDPDDFHGLVEVAPGVLGPRHGSVVIDLVEPSCEPIPDPNPLVRLEVFKESIPWIVIRVFK